MTMRHHKYIKKLGRWMLLLWEETVKHPVSHQSSGATSPPLVKRHFKMKIHKFSYWFFFTTFWFCVISSLEFMSLFSLNSLLSLLLHIWFTANTTTVRWCKSAHKWVNSSDFTGQTDALSSNLFRVINKKIKHPSVVAVNIYLQKTSQHSDVTSRNLTNKHQRLKKS